MVPWRRSSPRRARPAAAAREPQRSELDGLDRVALRLCLVRIPRRCQDSCANVSDACAEPERFPRSHPASEAAEGRWLARARRARGCGRSPADRWMLVGRQTVLVEVDPARVGRDLDQPGEEPGRAVDTDVTERELACDRPPAGARSAPADVLPQPQNASTGTGRNSDERELPSHIGAEAAVSNSIFRRPLQHLRGSPGPTVGNRHAGDPSPSIRSSIRLSPPAMPVVLVGSRPRTTVRVRGGSPSSTALVLDRGGRLSSRRTASAKSSPLVPGGELVDALARAPGGRLMRPSAPRAAAARHGLAREVRVLLEAVLDDRALRRLDLVEPPHRPRAAPP